MTKNNLIAVRLSDDELADLDSLGNNRSVTIRLLIAEAVPDPVDDPQFDPRYEDGDLAHDIAREEGR